MEPWDSDQQQLGDIKVSGILKSQSPSKTSEKEKSIVVNKVYDEKLNNGDDVNNNEQPEKIMIHVPYSSSPISSDNDEEKDVTMDDSDDDYTSIPFSISTYFNKGEENLNDEISKVEVENKIQHSQQFVQQRCACKCRCSSSISKVMCGTKCIPTSPAIPSREFNFPIPKSRLRTDRSEDCFGNLQKIKFRRSTSAQNFCGLNNSKTHYSTFRPQSAITPSTSEKKLTVPKVLNIQPDNIFKEHTLPVGRQTMKTLQYINKLHQKELILREEKNKLRYSSMVVLSEDLNDLCIKPLVTTRPQSAHPVMNPSQRRRWEKSGDKLLNSSYHQEYRLSKKEKLRKDIDHVAQLNCSNDKNNYYKEPNAPCSSLKKGQQRISSSIGCKKCSKPKKILQRVQFQQNI